MSTTEELLQCLAATQSPDASTRHQAEAQFNSFSLQHGFGVALLEILLSSAVDEQLRQLAAVLCRQFIHVHWTRQKAGFIEPEVQEEHKQTMRSQLVAALSLEQSKLRTAVSMAVASVAKEDFPDRWQELIPHLMGMLQAGQPHVVHGAMRCLVLVSEEITDNQVPHVITSLFPHLFTVFTAEGVHSKHVRARACTVMYKCIKLMSLLGDASDSEAVSLRLLETSVPPWLECFAQTISGPLPPDDAGELCMRIEMVRILTVLIEVYPRLLSSCMAEIIRALWQALATTVEVYEHLVVHGAGPVELDIDPADDVDGDRISVDALAWELMECVREAVSCQRARKIVRAELRPLAFAQIRFMQVTTEQLEAWAADVNAYIAHEDEGSFETSVRILAAEVVSEMCESFEEEGWNAVLAAVMCHLEGAEQERLAGRETWWLRREASMFAVTAICADVDALDGLGHIFSPSRFIREVVLPDAAADKPPVLRGRALHCISAFASQLEAELAGAAFQAAALSLSDKAPLPVRMTAARAIGSLATSDSRGALLPAANGEPAQGERSGVLPAELLRPHIPALLENIAQLLAISSEDSALITLEALHQVIKAASAEALLRMPLVVSRVLAALLSCGGDVMIASEAVETVECVVMRPECVDLVADQCVPVVLAILEHPDKYACTQVESVIELLSKIIRKSASTNKVPSILIEGCFPTLMMAMLQSDVDDILQPGCAVLRAYLREAPGELATLAVAGRSVPACFQEVGARLLGPEVADGVAAAAAPLLIQMVLREGEVHRDAIAGLLGMALERLAIAQTLQLRQALLVLFARLLVHDLSSTLAVLQAHSWSAAAPQGLPPGGGLGLLLVLWAREHSDLCGNYDMKVLSAALGVLLIHAPGEAMAMAVPGQMVVDVAEARMTRSQARVMGRQAGGEGKWTTMPFGAKAVWLLVEAVQREDEEAYRNHKDSEEAEDSDGDFEGSGSDGSVDEHAQGGAGQQEAASHAGAGGALLRGRPGSLQGSRWADSPASLSPSGGASGSFEGGAQAAGGGQGGPPITTDAAAAQREMVRSIMRGMNKLREDDTDPDRHTDPVAAPPLRDTAVQVLSQLAHSQQQRWAACLQHLAPDLQQMAVSLSETGQTSSPSR